MHRKHRPARPGGRHTLSSIARCRRCALPLVAGSLLLCTSHASAEDAHDDDPDHLHDTIIVTGIPLEHDRDELAVAIDRVDRDALLGSLGATLGESLQGRPGIATTGFSGGASRPVIRGQDAFRTEVTEDGLPTQDVSRESPDHAVPVNPLSVERIEIVRGPATLRYGGGASAGVVNAITNRVPDWLPTELVTGEVFGALDSVARRRDISFNLDGGRGQLAYHFDGLLRKADDYEIPTGGRQNGTFVDAFSGSAGASWFFGNAGRLGASYTRFESDYGIPEEDEDAHIEMRSQRGRFEGDWTPSVGGVSALRVRGVYTDYRHDEVAEGVVGQTFRNQQFDGRLELLHDPLLGFLGAVGVTGRTRSFEALGEAVAFLAPTQTTSVAGYVFEERALRSGLVAELGLRAEGTTVEGTPAGATQATTRSFVPLSGSLGLIWDTPLLSLTIGLLAAASQRAPDGVELFARGPHESTGTFELGDPSLDVERSYTGELRATFDDDDRVRVDLAGFVTWYEDYIFGQQSGRTVDEDGNPVAATDPGALDLLFYRDRDALFAGGEISAAVDVLYAQGGAFGVDGQFDYVRARFSSGLDRNLPRIPPIRWGAGLFYRGEWLRARVGFLRTEAQDQVSQFENPTDAFTFLDAGIRVLLTPVLSEVQVELAIQGRNLLDQEARNVVSFNADEVLLPGRNIRGSIRVGF